MTTASSQSLERFDDPGARWRVCFALVAALHMLGLAALSLSARPTITPPSAPTPSAVMVDMTPLSTPARPSTPQISPRPTPQHTETNTPSENVTPPKTPTVATAQAALPTRQEKQEQALAQTVSAGISPTPAPQAPTAATAPSKAAPTWQGLVLGRLERFKRYPEEARFRRQQGVVWLRFTMNRDGKTLSASIDKGSGYDLLDAEALALVRRAEPFPRPPAEVAGDRLELVAPVEFFMGKRR